MQSLDEIYENPNNDDNNIIIRSINTILEVSDNCHYVYKIMLLFLDSFRKLKAESKIKRDDIKFIVEQMDLVLENDDFDTFISILKNINNKNYDSQYKYLWMLCFLRSVFEIKYISNIFYKDPINAIKISTGEEHWSVFLDSLSNNNFVYIKK